MLSPDASNVEEINDLLGICEDFFSGKNTLIILDDCAVSKDLKNRTNKFINGDWVCTAVMSNDVVKDLRG